MSNKWYLMDIITEKCPLKMKKTAIQEELESILKCLNDLGCPVSVGTLESHIGENLQTKCSNNYEKNV